MIARAVATRGGDHQRVELGDDTTADSPVDCDSAVTVEVAVDDAIGATKGADALVGTAESREAERLRGTAASATLVPFADDSVPV